MWRSMSHPSQIRVWGSSPSSQHMAHPGKGEKGLRGVDSRHRCLYLALPRQCKQVVRSCSHQAVLQACCK